MAEAVASTAPSSPFHALLPLSRKYETHPLSTFSLAYCLYKNPRISLTILSEHDSDVETIAYSPDGTLLANGSDDEMAKIWDVSTRSDFSPRNYLPITWKVRFLRMVKR